MEGRWVLVYGNRVSALFPGASRTQTLAKRRFAQGPHPGAYLTRVGHDLLVAPTAIEMAPVLVPSSEGRAIHFTPATKCTEVRALLRQRQSQWAGLQMVALDRGYLRVAADLSSDDRLLLLYRGDGTVAALRKLRGPIGLAGVIAARREILVARTIEGVEVVRYRWRWQDRDGGG